MHAIELDYVRKHGGYSVKALLLLLAALLVLLAGAWYYLAMEGEVARSEQAVSANQRTLQRLQPVPERPRDKGLDQAIEQANAVWLSLNQPWPELFAALEASKTDDVALLAVEPDPLKHSVRITAEAKKREAMLAYIERLEQQPGLGSVVLLEHHINQQDNEKPFRFSLLAAWKTGS
ncbi:membrane protein [Pseudogulbenkiania sp. MAI-1]|uniref:membrane protein n=1 Tax=Pseudogulbenkiania sp. MAI-1 TaxID=990370 RepID=UPI00045E808E|nr:membrane protein [Pseudogulbenkiania sp. MAI-1]